MTAADYVAVEGWLRPMATTSALTCDMNDLVTAEAIKEANESGKVRNFMVVTTAGDRVGVVSYRPSGGHRAYVIGGAIGDPARWSSGVGGEAMGLLVDHLFHQLNAHRVEFATAAYNKHTISMLTKGGFVLEGVLRDFYFLDGEYHDKTIWSLLREEFVVGARQFKEQMPVLDLVPAKEKQRAKELLAKYIANEPGSSWLSFADRAARERPY
ncbi:MULTISPECIES: GNAT family N-acetyltransferase [unclassified Crossiella]|uniref:GNAT family N-acetyltransferase n=1 Tax=Crossiella sp. CA-258035 TaxID=2981138 RepID=UPI0024BD1ED0|nr:GNAT family protein [Crossiella sp. CA-258035]WHT20649.1 GNAT family protein [Crossiella sp. CA-258035]